MATPASVEAVSSMPTLGRTRAKTPCPGSPSDLTRALPPYLHAKMPAAAPPAAASPSEAGANLSSPQNHPKGVLGLCP